MYAFSVDIRVRYAETDSMQYVYYGRYAEYFEIARVEALRSLGISYRSIEEAGILLPVADFKIRYFKPARYDDIISVETKITSMPSVKLHFSYKTSNESREVLNIAETTLVFVHAESRRPCRAPKLLTEKLEKYFL